MLKFDKGDAQELASITQAAFSAVDDAMRMQARLTISFLDTTAASGTTERDRQRVLKSVHEGQKLALDCRSSLVSTTVMMTSLVKRSNQAETDFGCGGTGPWGGAFVGATLREQVESRV
jgi:hypothetical protein